MQHKQHKEEKGAELFACIFYSSNDNRVYLLLLLVETH